MPDAPRSWRHLAPCPASPNCVSSLESRTTRKVAPLRFGDDPARAFTRLQRILRSLPRVTIEESDSHYTHAVFRTRWLRFADDVEFLLDRDAGCIHVRSASRLGYWDLGANRRRVESLRAAWLTHTDTTATP